MVAINRLMGYLVFLMLARANHLSVKVKLKKPLILFHISQKNNTVLLVFSDFRMKKYKYIIFTGLTDPGEPWGMTPANDLAPRASRT